MPPTVRLKKGKCAVKTFLRGSRELEMVGPEFEECRLYRMSLLSEMLVQATSARGQILTRHHGKDVGGRRDSTYWLHPN